MSAGQSQLFRTFGKDKVSGHSQLKASVQRAIRGRIADDYPWLVETGVLDVILPKKQDLVLVKLPEHVQLLVLDKTPLFFSMRDGPWFPTLRLLHQYPDMMVKLRVDTGAIKFVLSGANIMVPGLTSPGATIHSEVEEGAAVAIYGENKQHAMAVGITKMSTAEMREVNKGIGIDNLHYLTDGLWKTPTF
ncbi:malignant T-cell-amplified sequence 1-like protein [Micractinium conductrix]|uniref:Malignant T-cell-amplified sequence 1-like protein n=1 Tax=Micractinium conductrix TaxID=554055 RepID=A0A2P6V5E7_9CHLO|nr:malignant T-cell-amplified sequence 1-like protein [Micractinium conductrix]|eukprot:PSC69287.1 malignant T-cell-amplified sequence 1-like protein [Micractinium conductrix]